MRKTVSLLLLLTLMLTSVIALLPVTASAATPEGTGIESQKDFIKKVTSDGVYYLEKDITLGAGFSGEFKGTFDGNGHTLTISGGSLFGSLSGATVKNLTVKGTINRNINSDFGIIANKATDSTFEDITVDVEINVSGIANFTTTVAAVVAEAGGNTTFTNVKNKGNITVSCGVTENAIFDQMHAAGIVGKTTRDANITIKKCENSGDILSSTTQVDVGGIIGFVENASVYLTECKNSGVLMGKATGLGAWAGVGGMIGRTNNKADINYNIVLSKCENTGDIKDTEDSDSTVPAGGMIGRFYSTPRLTIDSCINSGNIDIDSNGQSTWSGVGGIIGMFISFGCRWDLLEFCEVNIVNCTNSGTIRGAQPAGIVGGNFQQVQLKSTKINIEYCTNTGEIKGLGEGGSGKAGGILSGIDYYDGEDSPCLSLITIKNCKNEGTISEATYAGGIVGAFTGSVDVAGKPVIENCVNVGAVSANSQAGGIIAKTDIAIKISNSLNNGNVDAETKAGITNSDTNVESANNFYVSGGAAGKHGTAASVTDISAKIAAIAFGRSNSAVEINFDIAKADALYEIDYTAASWTPFKTALAAAKTVANDTSAEQTAVDAAEDALEEAMQSLVYKEPDRTAFAAKLEEAKSKKRADWQSTTYTYLTDTIANAEAVAGKSGVLQSELNAETEKLTEAIKNLKPRGESTTIPEGSMDDLFGKPLGGETSKPTETESSTATEAPTSTNAPATTPIVEEEGGCGSIIGGAAIAITAIVAVGTGIALKKKDD